MAVHFSRNINKPRAKTACGHVFDECGPGECLINDLESVDCERCLASDEFLAESMERALQRTITVDSYVGERIPEPVERWSSRTKLLRNYAPPHRKRRR